MIIVWLGKQDLSSFLYYKSNDVYVLREVGEFLYCYFGFMKNFEEEEKCLFVYQNCIKVQKGVLKLGNQISIFVICLV